MANYGLGHNFDTASRRLLRTNAAVLLGATPAVPKAASLERFEAPIFGQGQTGSCGGHGTAQALVTAFAAAGKPLPFVPSPGSIYRVVRALERAAATPRGHTLPLLSDSGIMPSDLLPMLATFGIEPMKGPTPDGRNSDVWGPDDVQGMSVPPNVNDEADLADLIVSGSKLVSGEFRIDEHAPNMLDLVCAALAGTGANQNGIGVPVGVGGTVDTAVMQWAKGDPPLSHVNLRDPRGGGHWFVCTSFYTLANGKRVFRFPNSWGASYGDAGHFEVTEDWMLAQLPAGLDLYPFKVA